MRRGAAVGLALLLTVVSGRAASDAPSDTPAELRRPPDQTFLTFPEWFLVHSPEEYATYVEDHPPSGFPFLAHVGQLWSSYGAVIEATREHDLNVGYHVMILVIASSTTVEYGLRALYENLVGRLFEATAFGGRTPEEQLAAEVARDYVDFINVRPWYEFDFTHPLVQLWTDVPLVGPDPLRKLERRYALTSELLAKAAYGWLIALGTGASYEPAAPTTAVVIEGLAGEAPEGVDLVVLDRLGDGALLATLPRYAAFGHQAAALAREGVRFREVAGNRGPIAISALAPRGWGARSGERVLFVQSILTRAERERVVFTVPVADLSGALRRLDDAGVALEHVYDF